MSPFRRKLSRYYFKEDHSKIQRQTVVGYGSQVSIKNKTWPEQLESILKIPGKKEASR